MNSKKWRIIRKILLTWPRNRGRLFFKNQKRIFFFWAVFLFSLRPIARRAPVKWEGNSHNRLLRKGQNWYGTCSNESKIHKIPRTYYKASAVEPHKILPWLPTTGTVKETGKLQRIYNTHKIIQENFFFTILQEQPSAWVRFLCREFYDISWIICKFDHL